ncbi:hypothetical protein OUZ56_033363 [Daphnia magna]|uniref:Uncharacterized protein n=1 Tax=Daphnia magna TaxID=35525 RepID=A0ABR0BAP1_9CRUS|nr:hypothetical protein OUZ56_033363 [Daphnia magna]
MVSQSKNSWYNSVFTLNTKVKTHGITKYKLMKYKLMVSQCIHIEYKSKNSWYRSVFTLNTKVKTHDIVTGNQISTLVVEKPLVKGTAMLANRHGTGQGVGFHHRLYTYLL